MRPPGMETFEVRFGPAQSLSLGTQLEMVVDFTPSTSAIWAATNTPLVAMLETVQAPAAGLQASAFLPSPDQDGFVDGRGNTVRNWTYRADIKFLADGFIVSSTTKVFTYTAGAQDPFDLEAAIPLASSSGVTVAIPVLTGATADGSQLVLYDSSGNEAFRGSFGGGGGSSAGFEYIQTTAAATWTITHSFGRRPVIDLFTLAGERIFTDVSATTSTATVTFPAPQAGYAVLT